MNLRGAISFGVVAVAAYGFEGNSFMEKFDALPQAVRQAAEAQMGHALPVSITSAKGEHGWDYQINTRLNGKYHDIVIDESGRTVAIRDEVEIGSVPAGAKAAIEKQAGGDGAKITALEKVTEGEQISYSATVRNEQQGGAVRVKVAPDGAVRAK